VRNVRIAVVALLAALFPAGLVMLAASSAGASPASGDFTVLVTTRVTDAVSKDPASKSPTPPAPIVTLVLKEGNGTVVSCSSAQFSVVKYATYESVNYWCNTPTKIDASYVLSIVGNPSREYATAGTFASDCFTTYTSSTLDEPPYTYTTQRWNCSAPQHPAPPAPPKK